MASSRILADTCVSPVHIGANCCAIGLTRYVGFAHDLGLRTWTDPHCPRRRSAFDARQAVPYLSIRRPGAEELHVVRHRDRRHLHRFGRGTAPGRPGGDPRVRARHAASSSSSRSSSTCTASRARSSCPSSISTACFEDGAGFAGFAAGDIGQRPSDPDLAAMPDARELHAAAVAAERRPHRLRPARGGPSRGPTARAPSCASSSSAPPALGYEFKIGAELEYFLLRRRADGGLEPADALDTLEQPCYDMRALTRNLDFVTEVARHLNALGWDNYATDHEDANGQFEQNFEYADALTTCDRAIFFRYMVESAGAGARADRHVHAEAVRPSDRQRLPLPHEPVEGRRERLRRADAGRRPARPGALARSPTSSSAASRRTRKAYIALTAPTVNSYKRLVVGSQQRLGVGAGLRQLRQQQPHPDAAHPRAGPDRGPHGRRLVQPVPGATAGILAAGLDGIERELDPGEPTSGLNLHELRAASADRAGHRAAARATCSTPRASSSATTCCARRSGSCEREDYVDYFVAIEARGVAAGAQRDHRLGAQALPAAVLAMDVRPDHDHPRRTRAAAPGERDALGGRRGSSARRPTSATCWTAWSTCSRRCRAATRASCIWWPASG